MKTIPLTRGYFTKVDDDDYEKFAIYRWYASTGINKKYIRPRRGYWIKGKLIKVWLHREIMNAKKGIYVDHINNDTLDNRKCNLRLCTKGENNHNRVINNNSTSGYKGVTWKKDAKKWVAQIQIIKDKKRKGIQLGYFITKEDAAKAYDKAALKYFGKFAKINFAEIKRI